MSLFPQDSESEKSIVETETNTKKNQDEKRLSAQFIIGNGVGQLGVLKDRYDPATSLSQFVVLALFSSAQAAPGFASSLSGNLNSSSLFNLYVLNDQLNSAAIQSSSQSSINRFYVEAHPPDDHIAFLYGLSTGSYSLKADASRNNNVFLPSLFFGSSNPILNIYMAQSFVENSRAINLSIDTLDGAVKYYFTPESKFDPYVSAGLGVGSCFFNCVAIRFFGKVGFRYNFESSYLFLEEEFQYVYFHTKENIYNPMRERMTLLGFGVYF
ncbi:MAG TPA: hypothetical protein PK079_16510 [Leptospiraceae bacterium]|nr:hypothetical protein [Leptospiraceae bacterium]HMX32455.1 hypothetical protein [Leptospiraceae bacterium]HMY31028.1 hypothetical protein [Leptospiraceae bacterium]HMZ65062.1 hypothetical protein [Leptospiraceae bacterium]HNA05668.1 hypothetical protein [Leptospiraceae bacterium]